MAIDMNDLLNADVDAIVEKGQARFNRSKKRLIDFFAVFMAVCVIGVAVCIAVPQIHLWLDYNNAAKLMEDGKYEEAITAFKALDDYKDSAEMINEVNYQWGNALMSDSNYDEAILKFTIIKNYKDGTDLYNEARYRQAIKNMDSENYSEAINAFKSLGTYKNSEDMLNEIYYQQAIDFLNSENYSEAVDKFRKLGDYKDSADIQDRIYCEAIDNFNTKNYTKALKQFLAMLDYKDSKERLDTLIVQTRLDQPIETTIANSSPEWFTGKWLLIYGDSRTLDLSRDCYHIDITYYSVGNDTYLRIHRIDETSTLIEATIEINGTTIKELRKERNGGVIILKSTNEDILEMQFISENDDMHCQYIRVE